MSEAEGESKGFWAKLLAVFTVLTQLWGAIPEESRKKLICTIADGFDSLLRRFFRKYHAIETQPGQELAP